MKVSEKIFTGQTLNIDDKIFEKCSFIRCELVYAGGLVDFEHCSFDSPRFTFKDAAKNTLTFMAIIYRSGDFGRDMVEGTFKNIRAGKNIQSRPKGDAGLN